MARWTATAAGGPAMWPLLTNFGIVVWGNLLQCHQTSAKLLSNTQKKHIKPTNFTTGCTCSGSCCKGGSCGSPGGAGQAALHGRCRRTWGVLWRSWANWMGKNGTYTILHVPMGERSSCSSFSDGHFGNGTILSSEMPWFRWGL